MVLLLPHAAWLSTIAYYDKGSAREPDWFTDAAHVADRYFVVAYCVPPAAALALLALSLVARSRRR